MTQQLLYCVLVFIATYTLRSYGAIRVVTYNMLSGESNYNSSTLDDKIEVLKAIGDYPYNNIQRPFDILVAQELSDNHIIERYLINGYGSVDGLNDYYGAGTYAYAPGTVIGDGYNYNGMIYNTNTVQLLETICYRATNAPRGTMRYKFKILGYGEDAYIYVFNAHMKAYDNEAGRLARTWEAAYMRWSRSYGGDSLPEGTNIIYAGDFNLIDGGIEDCTFPVGDLSSLGGYDNPWYYLVKQEQFIGATGATFSTTGYGLAVDPSGQTYPRNWNSGCTYRSLHTYDSYYPSTRLDFQLVSEELYDGEGVSFIGPGVGNSIATENSLRPLGNDGTHYCRGRIKDSTSHRYASSLFNYLDAASDHLPVIADYQVPAVMSVSVDMPSDVSPAQQVYATVTVENSANVTAVAGADELNYEIVVLQGGTLIGNSTGTDYPLGNANEHQILLDTSSTGSQTLEIQITSSNHGVVNGTYCQTFDYDVNLNCTLPDFVRAWLTEDGQANWNSNCDICSPQDGRIDLDDFAVLASDWQ